MFSHVIYNFTHVLPILSYPISPYYQMNNHTVHVFFFFSSRRRHTRCSRDWSSDVCSSDLRSVQPMAMLWLVEAWFLGVLLLSLRTAGGLFLIERMRRKEINPVGGELFERCEIGRASCRERG